MGRLTNDQLVTVYLSKVWSEEKARWEVCLENDPGFSVFPSGKCCWVEEGSDPPHIGSGLCDCEIWFSQNCLRDPGRVGNWQIRPLMEVGSQIWLSIQPQRISPHRPKNMEIYNSKLKLHGFLMQYLLARAGVISKGPPARREGINCQQTRMNMFIVQVIATSLLSGQCVQLNWTWYDIFRSVLDLVIKHTCWVGILTFPKVVCFWIIPVFVLAWCISRAVFEYKRYVSLNCLIGDNL